MLSAIIQLTEQLGCSCSGDGISRKWNRARASNAPPRPLVSVVRDKTALRDEQNIAEKLTDEGCWPTEADRASILLSGNF
jgi:hypothetical protein